jgi:hypothetical protein
MRNAIKPFLLGIAASGLVGAGIAYAGQGQVNILPSRTLVINSPAEAVPVRVVTEGAQTGQSAGTLVRADRALPVEIYQHSVRRWEYRTFADQQEMISGTATNNAQAALNKLGSEGWEMVSPFTFKRPKLDPR